MLGLYSGATTDTPSLGAAQQTLASFPGVSAERHISALAYAVSYPMGIVGIIGSLLLLRWMFQVDIAAEQAAFNALEQATMPPLERRTLIVETRICWGFRSAKSRG